MNIVQLIVNFRETKWPKLEAKAGDKPVVRMLLDVVKNHVDGIIYRPVGKLQEVQNGSLEGFEVEEKWALK